MSAGTSRWCSCRTRCGALHQKTPAACNSLHEMSRRWISWMKPWWRPKRLRRPVLTTSWSRMRHNLFGGPAHSARSRSALRYVFVCIASRTLDEGWQRSCALSSTGRIAASRQYQPVVAKKTRNKWLASLMNYHATGIGLQVMRAIHACILSGNMPRCHFYACLRCFIQGDEASLQDVCQRRPERLRGWLCWVVLRHAGPQWQDAGGF